LKARAGGIVDEDEQRVHWPAGFEPALLAAVDLDERAEALAAVAWLVRRPNAVASICSPFLSKWPALVRRLINPERRTT